ncbi:MAG: alkaline phosphatase family protein [Candidatus Aminicenantales bacterium]
MKFVKVLLNSLLSGFFSCLLLSLLISDLNINLHFDLRFFFQLSFFLFLTYGVAISFLCFISFFIIQFFFGRRFKIAIVSPSFLSISFTFILFLFLWLFKQNRSYFKSLFSAETENILKIQSILLLAGAIIGLVAFYGYNRYRKKSLVFILYFILLFAALVYCINLRFQYAMPIQIKKVANIEAKEIDKKITIIGLEGLSFDFLIPAINEGKLPNFSWLMENGSWGKLESFPPSEPIIFTNSFSTGKLPSKHRLISLFTFHPWNVSEPIEVTPRYILFRQMTKSGLLRVLPNRSSPRIKDIWEIFKENGTSYIKKDWPYELQNPEPSPRAEKLFSVFFDEMEFAPADIFRTIQQAFYRDFAYEEKVSQERGENPPQILYFLLNGLNAVETCFYKYSFPDLFGDIDQEDITRYGKVIEKYYEFYDQIIGKYLAGLKEDELLVVFSPHGIEPLPLWKRFIERLIGNVDVSAYHESAPESAIFFYGKDILRGNNIVGMNLIDVVPTLLNYLGLPVGKDMDGLVNTSIFVETFKKENPILYISSYEEITIARSKK